MSRWADGFANYSRGRIRDRAPAQFGSFLGMSTEKTIADLRQLIKAKDDELAQIEKHLRDTPGKVDPDWLSDWKALKDRYAKVRDAAQKAMGQSGGFLGPADRFFEGFTSAKQYYDALLKALQQSYPDLHVTKGDLQDLFNRMPFAIAALPQPGNPPSSQVYQAVDMATKFAVPTPAKAVVQTVFPNLVPQTVDAPSYRQAAEGIGTGISHSLMFLSLVVGGVAVAAIAIKRK